MNEALALLLRRLIALTGAAGGFLEFRPERAAPVAVSVGPRRTVAALTDTPSAPRGALHVPLGTPARRVGRMVLIGRGRPPRRAALPGGFGRELGHAIEIVWRQHRRALRTTLLTEITRLLGS